MLAFWSLIPLPFLNPTGTSESSQFTYCWSLAWRILSITLLACEMSAVVQKFEHSLALPFFGIGMKTDLTKAEDIKKRWQEYTEKLYKKDLHNPDNHDGVITHLEPDILECKVKWTLGSITTNKASGGDGVPVELFQILKDDAVKVLHSICQ